MNFKTPGVNIREIDAFPSSLAAPSTCVPAFIGCTQKQPDSADDPTLVTSLLQYVSLFGTSPIEPITVTVDKNAQVPIQACLTDEKLKQIMYYNLQLFFNNGGGECYVVSLRTKQDSVVQTVTVYENAINSLEKKPDITLLVLTDAGYYLSDNAARKDVYSYALKHCDKMQNRFTLFDADYGNDGANFRESVGTENLQYGAAYTPCLDTSITPQIAGADNETPDIIVFGAMQKLITDQFEVTYSGEFSVENSDQQNAFFAVVLNKEINKPVFSIDDNTLTITTSTKSCIRQVIRDWNDWDGDKGGFILEQIPTEISNPTTSSNNVSPISKTPFSRLSNYMVSQYSLNVFFTGSAQAAPKVEFKKNITKEAKTTVTVQHEKLTISYKKGAKNIDILTAAKDVDLHLFRLTTSADDVNIEEDGVGVFPLETVQCYVGCHEGLKFKHTNTVQKNLTVEIKTNTVKTQVKAAEPIKLKSQNSTPEITFIVEESKLTITCDSDVLASEISKAWIDHQKKGGFEMSGDDETPITPVHELPLFKSTNSTSLQDINDYNTQDYNQITAAIDTQVKVSNFPASGAIAGIYNKVDAQRGVWQSPANIALNSVIAPSISISAAEQENLNVDASTGKSINAIRPFLGKGTLVWGARTLDGNSNDWRYVSVRRLISYIENTLTIGLQNFVFESNNAMTWLKVRAMIEPFLEDLWQQGALVGSKMDDAFYVNVGLGTTMTPQDILQGRMNISLGLAAVRPAEFIVLNVTQLQQN